MAKKLDSHPKASKSGSEDLTRKAYTGIRRMLFLNEMPGEPELKTETERLKTGIPAAENTEKELKSLARSLGLSLPLID